MKTSLHCPETADLRKLLDGSLSGDQADACTDHMEACGACRERLEGLATDGTNLSRIVEGLREPLPSADSAYWPALESLDAEFSPAGGVKAIPRPDVTLSFLQPAVDRAYLGRLAHFDVMRVLGRGGMGIVLEAFDSHLQRHVALKVLDPELAHDEVARQRFCREARAAASITHENVVAVHQVEKAQDGTLPYLVMQLVTGETLEQRLVRERKLPLAEIVRIGMQAAHGLAAAHAQGLIHRDIKPGNILLEPPHDRVKLTDFGLARAAEDVKLTRTGYVSGTPLYMAPEQALGEEPDQRSDLFSLGAVLYEMCAGHPPFQAESALGVLRQVSEAKHRPLREANPEIPEWLSKTVDRLLAKKPADRIASAAQLAELFDFEWALIRTSSEDVPRICQIEQRKRTLRNRWIATAVGATFLAVGLLGGWWMAHRGGPVGTGEPDVVSAGEPEAVLSANSGAVWSVAFSPVDDTVAMAVEDGMVRLWDIPSRSVKSTFDTHRGSVWKTRFSQDGGTLATAGDDGAIKIWKIGQAEPIQTFKHSNAVRGVAFASDDKTLFAGDREGVLRIWSLDATEPVKEAHQPGAIYAVALTPDEETVATAGSDKIVRLWNAKTLSLRLPLAGHTGPIYGLAFAPDSRRLASVGWDKSVRIWDSGSGELLKTWKAHDGDAWGVAWSPDGSTLATGGLDGAVKLWNPETGELTATYLGHKVAIHTVAFNHDGTRLASGGRDGAVRVWKLAP